MARGRRAYIERFMRAGWKFQDGYLTKGNVSTKPGIDAPGPFPGDVNFNPRKDAFAIRLGAVFVSDNRYWHEGRQVYLDRNGDVTGIDPATGEDECPECNGMPYHVKVPVLDNKGRPVRPPRYNFTYCRRCVSREEAEQVARRREAAGAARKEITRS